MIAKSFEPWSAVKLPSTVILPSTFIPPSASSEPSNLTYPSNSTSGSEVEPPVLLNNTSWFVSIAIISVPPSCIVTPVAPSIVIAPSEEISLTASAPIFNESAATLILPNEPTESEEPLNPPSASIVNFEPEIKFAPCGLTRKLPVISTEPVNM